MEFAKNIKDIEFNTVTMYGETMEVSEPIVMASAAGWYVGKVCKEDGFVQPYDRFTEYMTQEKAQVVLDTPIENGRFNENFGVVEKEFG
jgi:hypothetical protein